MPATMVSAVRGLGVAVAGLAVAAGSIALARGARWRATTTELTERLTASTRSIAPALIQLDQLGELPAPVARYFRFAFTDGQPIARSARLTQVGEFRISPTPDGWRPMRAEQTMAVAPPGFVWSAQIATAPLVTVRVRDVYLAGRGAMRAEVASLATVVDQHDRPELAAGALQRYLAEAVWLPPALLPSQGVVWTPIDDHTASATLTDGATTVTLEFRFADSGAISGVFAPGRFREVNGRYEPTPWQGELRQYETRQGMRIPTEATVKWLLPAGDFAYFRCRIAAAEFDVGSAPNGASGSGQAAANRPGALARWLYRGGRPSRLAAWLNRGWAAVGAVGWGPNRLVTLETRGRRSGRVIAFPLVVADYRGERYLVAMLGEPTRWVANVRAAGGRATLCHGGREPVRLTEVAPTERAPILQRYLQVAPGARPHLPVDWRAPLAEFERIAPLYPVFRVGPDSPVLTAAR